jgi:hypothetical protein
MVIYAMALPERYDIACGAEVIDPMSKFVVSHVQRPRDEA